jgi:hypothetical protein
VDDDVRAFGTELGRMALGREWPAVHAMLAPWLRATWTIEQVRQYPEPGLDGNGFTKATQLREPISFAGGKVRNVAPEVTDNNIRYWLKLQLHCSDEQMEKLGFDSFCEAWMAVVDTAEGLRVGYWSQGAY